MRLLRKSLVFFFSPNISNHVLIVRFLIIPWFFFSFYEFAKRFFDKKIYGNFEVFRNLYIYVTHSVVIRINFRELMYIQEYTRKRSHDSTHCLIFIYSAFERIFIIESLDKTNTLWKVNVNFSYTLLSIIRHAIKLKNASYRPFETFYVIVTISAIKLNSSVRVLLHIINVCISIYVIHAQN